MVTVSLLLDVTQRIQHFPSKIAPHEKSAKAQYELFMEMNWTTFRKLHPTLAERLDQRGVKFKIQPCHKCETGIRVQMTSRQDPSLCGLKDTLTLLLPLSRPNFVKWTNICDPDDVRTSSIFTAAVFCKSDWQMNNCNRNHLRNCSECSKTEHYEEVSLAQFEEVHPEPSLRSLEKRERKERCRLWLRKHQELFKRNLLHKAKPNYQPVGGGAEIDEFSCYDLN